MKRTLIATTLLAGLIAQTAQANFSLPVITWAGTYKDSNGGLMVVEEKPLLLNAWGADSASIYQIACTRPSGDERSATCVGAGINHEQPNNPTRFTYRSQLRLNTDGSISETWEALIGSQRRNGQSQFRRAGSAER